MATENSTTDHPVIFQSAWAKCVHLPRPPERRTERYAIVTTAGELIGEIRWQGSQQRYVLLPREQWAWPSGQLSEIAVWLRRLTRRGVAAHHA